MEFEVRITRSASQNIKDIYYWLLKNTESKIESQKIIDKIVQNIFSLGVLPERYQVIYVTKDGIRLRRMVVKNYSIIYIVEEDVVNILHVYHNSMDIETRLKKDSIHIES